MSDPLSSLLLAPSWQFLFFARSVFILASLCFSFSSCERAAVGSAPPLDPKREQRQLQHPSLEGSSKLTVLTWEEYLPPKMLERFEEQHNVEIDYQTIENSTEFAQLLASEPGRFDVVIVDDRTLIELDQLKLLQYLDISVLKNFGNLNPEFLGRDFDPDNSRSIPYLWGTTLIAYRKDHIPNPPQSWRNLLDGGLTGQLALLDEPNDLLLIGLLAVGADPETASQDQFDEATDLLLGNLKEHGGTMWNLYDALDALNRGEISAAVTYSGDALIYAEENEQIGYFIPDEGAPIWIDNLAICRNSQNSEEALRFIDFMIQADVAAATANRQRLASPNLAAAPMIAEALRTDPAIYLPKEVMARCQFVRLDGARIIQQVNRSISRIYELERQSAGTAVIPSSDGATITEPGEKPLKKITGHPANGSLHSE